SAPASGVERELHVLLESSLAGATPESTVRAALVKAWSQRLAIAGESSAGPTLVVDLKASDIEPDMLRSTLRKALKPLLSEAEFEGSIAAARQQATIRPDLLEAEVAFGAGKPAGRPVVADAAVPKLDPAGKALYVIRCVFRRPQC